MDGSPASTEKVLQEDEFTCQTRWQDRLGTGVPFPDCPEGYHG